MASSHSLARQLAMLKLAHKMATLGPYKPAQDLIGVSVIDFKNNLLEKVANGQVSDSMLVHAVNCLDKWRCLDRQTNDKIAKEIQKRPEIYGNGLTGGVLSAYSRSKFKNMRHRRYIESSCRVIILKATKEFQGLKTNVTNWVRLRPLLENLIAVGACYKIPASAKARLEAAILESSCIFEVAFQLYPMVTIFIKTLDALEIKNEKIAEKIVQAVKQVYEDQSAQRLEPLQHIHAAMENWIIGKSGFERSAMTLLKY